MVASLIEESFAVGRSWRLVQPMARPNPPRGTCVCIGAACHPFPMPRYSSFVALSDGPGRYQELEGTIDAPNPRTAAQRAIDLAAIHPDDQFPVILIVEERNVFVFSRNDDGQAVTPDEDFSRLSAKGPDMIDIYPMESRC